MPAQGTLSSGYGWRWGWMHSGIDIAGTINTPVEAQRQERSSLQVGQIVDMGT